MALNMKPLNVNRQDYISLIDIFSSSAKQYFSLSDKRTEDFYLLSATAIRERYCAKEIFLTNFMCKIMFVKLSYLQCSPGENL